LTFLWMPFIPQRILEMFRPIAIVALLFIIIPAVSIILTRIYMILTAKVDATYTQDNGGE